MDKPLDKAFLIDLVVEYQRLTELVTRLSGLPPEYQSDEGWYALADADARRDRVKQEIKKRLVAVRRPHKKHDSL